MKKVVHEQIIQTQKGKIHFSEPIVFVDNEKRKRSGHMSHAMVEFAPGKIMAFNSNCSGTRYLGHSAHGWMEFRISEDYGKTWGDFKKIPYSWEVMIDGLNTISIEKALAMPNGDIVAFCLMNSQYAPYCCNPFELPPKVLITHDLGETWDEPFEFSKYNGRIYDAMLVDGVAYVLEFCNESGFGDKEDDAYRIFKSEDNGKSWQEVSVVPYPSTLGHAYGSMTISPKGELIVYAYNSNDQVNMSCAISPDMGKTWTKVGKSFVKKQIRNPQVGRLDEYYILTGRAGQNETIASDFVIYTSLDGIHWDDGLALGDGIRRSCWYSCMLPIKMPNGKTRLYVKYSENYNDFREYIGCQVNNMLAYFEKIEE